MLSFTLSKFLNKATMISNAGKESAEVTNLWRLCTITLVEDLNILICMFPIWASGIKFFVVYAQMSSLFIEQRKMMDTTIVSLIVPPASLSSFDIIVVIIWDLIYDRGIILIVRKFIANVRGFSELQRMGIYLFLSIFMSATALVESMRLQMAKEL